MAKSRSIWSEMDSPESTGESSAKIDTAATAAITEAIRQWIKDLDVEVERINAAREALLPPVDRTAPQRPSDEQRSKRRQSPVG
jgi:hypothetical protein